MAKVISIVDSDTGALVDVAGNSREGGRYRKFVKVVKDNFDTVSMRAEVMLANLRILLRETFVRLISGRPRKRSRHDAFPAQLEFDFS